MSVFIIDDKGVIYYEAVDHNDAEFNYPGRPFQIVPEDELLSLPL